MVTIWKHTARWRVSFTVPQRPFRFMQLRSEMLLSASAFWGDLQDQYSLFMHTKAIIFGLNAWFCAQICLHLHVYENIKNLMNTICWYIWTWYYQFIATTECSLFYLCKLYKTLIHTIDVLTNCIMIYMHVYCSQSLSVLQSSPTKPISKATGFFLLPCRCAHKGIWVSGLSCA